MCSADEIPILYLNGYELTCEYLEQRGFDVPVIVDRPDGLDLRVPPPTFTVQDVENYVGGYAVWLMSFYLPFVSHIISLMSADLEVGQRKLVE